MKWTILILITCVILSCQQKPTYFTYIAKNDMPLEEPVYGEWRYKHKERYQSVPSYKENKPSGKKVIYLLPVGEFSPSQAKALQTTTAYVEIYYQVKTILLPPIPDTGITTREHEGHTQLLAPEILSKVTKCPNDGLALMAFTAKDLYPKPDWNYVFGLGSYTHHVGVTSVFRLAQADDTTFNRRLAAISTHEIGHMLSISHCLHARCVMNGTNGLYETDVIPLRPCSECQQKLYHTLQYDNLHRLQQLSRFCQDHGWQDDHRIFTADINCLSSQLGN